MARPPVPVPSKRDDIAQGLAEYHQDKFPADSGYYLTEAESGAVDLLDMMDAQAAEYEQHLGDSKPHDPNDCYKCHYLRPQDEEGHDRSTCKECIAEDAREIANEEAMYEAFMASPYVDLASQEAARVPDRELLDALGYGDEPQVEVEREHEQLSLHLLPELLFERPPRPDGIQRFVRNLDD